MPPWPSREGVCIDHVLRMGQAKIGVCVQYSSLCHHATPDAKKLVPVTNARWPYPLRPRASRPVRFRQLEPFRRWASLRQGR
eukprot:7205764-Pyramimonas_sp.AAC.1